MPNSHEKKGKGSYFREQHRVGVREERGGRQFYWDPCTETSCIERTS
jgi:stalled ribosome alternative rescue factor ArfA